MSLFNVDFGKLFRAGTPELMWGARMKAFMQAVASPFGVIWHWFASFRDANLYRLSHSSQVCRMEAVLNDAFDNTLRRIVIDDGPIKESPYLYRRAEQKPLYIYRNSENKPVWMYTTAETLLTGPDFLVKVPIGLVYDAARMRALINDYRLASKKDYLIIAV